MNLLKKEGDFPMGTNYYLLEKITEEQLSLQTLKSIVDSKILTLPQREKLMNLLNQQLSEYEIHLCKLSHGHTPFFREHKNWSTWEKLKDYISNNVVKIIDEYDREFTVVEFINIVEKHDSNNRKEGNRLEHWMGDFA